jgi:hypothetical protein
VALALLTSAVCGCAEPPRHVGAERLHVEAHTELAPADLAGRLELAAEPRLRSLDKWREAHVARADDATFPDGRQLQLAAARDPGLAEYAALPAQARRLDLYVFTLADHYWTTSEYTCGREPVLFKSDFLIHLGSDLGRGTRVEVLEYRPRVHLGDRFVLFGHHGPGRYADVRFVGPTTREREELVDLVLELARAPNGAVGHLSTPR